MRRHSVRLLLAGAALLATAGCATSEEWTTWREHSSHWASSDHFLFSVKNREGAPTRVTRADISIAREQSWWGRPITVSQEQILER
jgi:hypothetical protein